VTSGSVLSWSFSSDDDEEEEEEEESSITIVTGRFLLLRRRLLLLVTSSGPASRAPSLPLLLPAPRPPLPMFMLESSSIFCLFVRSFVLVVLVRPRPSVQIFVPPRLLASKQIFLKIRDGTTVLLLQHQLPTILLYLYDF